MMASGNTFEFLRRLRLMTFGRVLVVGVLLGVTSWVEPVEANTGALSTDFLLLVVGSGVLGLSLFYALALRIWRSERSLRRLAYVQLAGDAVFAAFLVLITGGTSSSFTFFFSVTILLAAVILFGPGALFQATCCTVLFITIGILELSGSTPDAAMTDLMHTHGSVLDQSEQAGLIGALVYKLINNVLAFYAVGFLASHLAESLRERDVQLEETAESLQNLRALHASIIASIPSGVMTTDADDAITYFNPRAVDITGIPASAARNQVASALFPILLPYLAQPAAPDEPLLIASTLVQQDAQRRHLQWQVSELRDPEGENIGHLVILQDVTDLREMQEQVRAAEQLAGIGRLAASIAHEIRNPLTSISGSIQLLSQTLDVQGANKKLMAIVGRETDALNAWITDFLSYARPRSSQAVPIDLRALVDDVVTAAGYDQSRSDVSLKVRGPDKTMVMGDATYLRQAVWNLVINAVQASPPSGIVRCKISRTQVPGESREYVRLAVADKGSGIEPDVQSRIFDPFVTTKEHGTGLGLATAYRVVTEHSGRLTFETSQGAGSTFYVDLPSAPLHPGV